MSLIKRAILALVLAAGIAPAFAQVPPPVPALPDTERRTSYSISASTCACAVGFQLYGDSTDVVNWLEVFVNGVLIPQSGNWAITSPTGPIATIPRPITDALLTFTAAQTGTVQIVGARRPRRTSQFQESQPVPTRNFNQVFSDITATLRELWDKTNDFTGRGVFAPPGETLKILPALANRQNMGACFDSGGNLQPCVAASSGSFVAGAGISFTGTNPTTIAATNVLVGANNTWTGTNTSTGDQLFGSGRPWCDLLANGAVGNSATVDTAAFNACLTKLVALGGGIMFVPPNTSCYLINAINATAKNNITVQGTGNSSCLTINSADASGNWLDLSASNGWSLDNLRINDNGVTIPKVAILWACTGTQCATSGVLHDFYINRLYISVHTTSAILYGYGFGAVDPTNGGHGNSLKIDSSTFVELNNGASTATFSSRNTPLHLTATNDLAITSANQVITATSAYSSNAVIINSEFTDFASLGGGSNNAGMVLFNEYPFTMYGGSIKCGSCNVDLVIASNNQGLAFYQVNFVAPGGASIGPSYWIGFVQGLNTFVTFDNPFFSSPVIATVLFGPPVGSLGGGWYINFRNSNNAGNFGSQGFIYTNVAACTGFAAANNWIVNSYFQPYSGGSSNNVQTCGSIDSHTIFQGAVTVTVPGGATDASHHF
jgi:hypothetical protein